MKLQDQRGREFYALFTDHQLHVARMRAGKNPEDILKSSFIADLVD